MRLADALQGFRTQVAGLLRVASRNPRTKNTAPVVAVGITSK
jgi:hypothetical protein